MMRTLEPRASTPLRLHYSAYWRTWSRVLHEDRHGFIELNLTARDPEGWQRNAREIVRCHCTPRDRRDQDFTGILDALLMELQEYYPADLVERLLYFDYLGNVPADVWRLAYRSPQFLGQAGARYHELAVLAQIETGATV